MPSWVNQTATEGWRLSIRKALKERQPSNIREVLACPKYGLRVSNGKSKAHVNVIDFGYIDENLRFLARDQSPPHSVRDCSAVETAYISSYESSSRVSSVFCLDTSHPFTFEIEKDSSDMDEATSVHVGLSAANLPSLPNGVYQTWMILLCETPPTEDQMSVLDFATHTFCIGVRLRLAHVNAADVRAMTVHAPTFVPQALRCTFNAPLPCWTLPRELLPLHSAMTTVIDNQVPQYALQPSPPHSSHELLLQQQQLDDVQSYRAYFTALLHMEEVQMAKDIHVYDQFNVRLNVHRRSGRNGQMPPHALECMKVSFDVPGAIEGRPVLLQGSTVRLRSSGGLFSCVEIHGVVLDVKMTTVTLLVPATVHGGDVAYVLPSHGFNPFIAQHVYESELFHVRFTYPRQGLRLAYDSLATLTPSTMAMLSPEPSAPGQPLDRPRVKLHELTPHNEEINDRQLQAVWHIVNKSSGQAPYIIFGPPGTGKTITVIESILQVLQHDPNARVLAVAPSDAAADILGVRLRTYLNKAALFRFNWPHRKIASVPGPLLGFCHVEPGKDVFSLPKLAQLLAYRVVVTTCALSGLLKFAQVPVGHFSHCFVDEACQATEPETLVALALCDRNTHVTLAGDPMQLGPSCRSRAACHLRLAQSFQERLMSLPMYDCATVGNLVRIVKLINNYRSHSALISLSSSLFYNNELLACADPRVVDSMCEWTGLAGRSQFPMMFYAVNGTQQRSIESPSFYNPLEAIKVADVIDDLLATTTVSTKDIAVITPFRQQVLKLRQLLRARGHGAVNVGTVYNFQGQESKICILSTVMTSMETMSRDYAKSEKQIPVLSDYKSFNVAFTRAMALCVVVGHAEVLSRHDLWSFMMGYCLRQGAYEGAGSDDADIAFSPTPPSIKVGTAMDEPLDDPEWHLFM